MNSDIQDREYLKALTLLYIEDDEDTRSQFCQFLQRLVGNLVTVINGAEGLVAYREHTPDIIITDIQTPVMDGLFMAREIRNTNKSIPIIVLTAFEQIDYLKKSINIGVTSYITKPIDCEHLQKILFELAQRLQVERELRQVQELLLDERNRLAEIVEGFRAGLNGDHTPAAAIVDSEHGAEPGINQIDEYHLCLIGLLDNINGYLFEDTENSLDRPLAELFDYTVQHFSNEDHLMEINDYPEKREHAKEHDMFTRQVAKFQQDMIDGNSMLAMEMVRFLKNWLLDHIQNCDRNYFKFMAAEPVK